MNNYQYHHCLKYDYHTLGLTQQQIADKYQVSKSLIQYFMKKFSIAPHPQERIFIKTIAIRLGLLTYEKLRQESQRTKLSMGSIIRKAILEYQIKNKASIEGHRGKKSRHPKLHHYPGYPVKINKNNT